MTEDWPPQGYVLADPIAEAKRLIEEVIYSHAHKHDRGGYFSDPHVYNECEIAECMWCAWARDWIKRVSDTSIAEHGK